MSCLVNKINVQTFQRKRNLCLNLIAFYGGGKHPQNVSNIFCHSSRYFGGSKVSLVMRISREKPTFSVVSVLTATNSKQVDEIPGQSSQPVASHFIKSEWTRTTSSCTPPAFMWPWASAGQCGPSWSRILEEEIGTDKNEGFTEQRDIHKSDRDRALNTFQSNFPKSFWIIYCFKRSKPL